MFWDNKHYIPGADPTAKENNVSSETDDVLRAVSIIINKVMFF
jgi:hypothetical protein